MTEIINFMSVLDSWFRLFEGILVVISMLMWALSNFDKKNFKLVMLSLALLGSSELMLWTLS